MEKRVLTSDELLLVKNFINKRGFEFFDLQLEILDHTAAAVEEKITQNPAMSVEKALVEVHASFGPLGFVTIEDAFIKQLSKKKWKNAFQIWYQPKTVVSVLLFTFFLFMYFKAATIYFPVMVAIPLALLAWGIYDFYQFYKIKGGKKFLSTHGFNSIHIEISLWIAYSQIYISPFLNKNLYMFMFCLALSTLISWNLAKRKFMFNQLFHYQNLQFRLFQSELSKTKP